MFRTLVFAAFVIPAVAFAKDGDRSSPPKQTKTTTTCKAGQVWDKKSKSCINAQSGLLGDDVLYDAVRELAYAGQFQNAQTVLGAMTDQNDHRVLTYWGFTHRRMGDMPRGMAFYQKAIATNPGSILARSYMGQAMVEMGDYVGARDQLLAIRDYGGAGTWAEVSLRTAIETGSTYNH
ncbi:MAG: hypothetical protein AAGF53_08755 [Pseudomonadota bacterium]